MVHVFVGPCVIGGEHAWPAVGGQGCGALADAMRLVDARVRQIDADAYICGRLGT
jgi:riboflavin biosynthesis pyrimidine reductase